MNNYEHNDDFLKEFQNRGMNQFWSVIPWGPFLSSLALYVLHYLSKSLALKFVKSYCEVV